MMLNLHSKGTKHVTSFFDDDADLKVINQRCELTFLLGSNGSCAKMRKKMLFFLKRIELRVMARVTELPASHFPRLAHSPKKSLPSD